MKIHDNDAIQLGKAIAAMQPPALRQIYLTKNSIGDTGAIGLAKGRKSWRRWTRSTWPTITLVQQEWRCSQILHLGCTTLVFTRNPIGDDGAAFARALAD